MVESTIRNYFSSGEIMLNLTTENENVIEQNQLRLFIHMYGEFALRIINNFPFSNQKYDSIEHYFDNLTFNGKNNSTNEAN